MTIKFAGRLFALLAPVVAPPTIAWSQPQPAPPPQLSPEQVAAIAAELIERGKMPDSPGTGPYRVVKHVLPGLPDEVVYQPADLAQLGDRKMPVYVFGNGSCSEDAASSRHHLIEIASHGYLVISPGGIFSGPGIEMTAESLQQHRSKTSFTQLGRAIDWAIAENSRKDSPFYGKIATDRVVASGYSCGGVQALKYAGDPRIRSFVIMNSGIFPENSARMQEMQSGKDLLDKIDVPILYVLGGPRDIAYANGMDDFSRIRNAPVAVINIDVTHAGTYADPNGGRAAQAVVNWLEWQMRDDIAAAKWFVGPDCRLCKDAAWTIQWRNQEMLKPTP